MYSMTTGPQLFTLTPLGDEEGYVCCAICGWEGVGLTPFVGEWMLLHHLREWHPDPIVSIEDLEGHKLR